MLRIKPLYEEAKASLKKFKGDERSGNEHLAIKFEPSYLEENEEALLTAGYVSVRPNNQGYNRGRALWDRGVYRNKYSDVERNANTMNAKSKKINPKGSDGPPFTCKCCVSFRHLLIDYPDSWENMKKGSEEEDEYAVLFLSNRQTDNTQWKACNYTILDSACSSTICGKKWLKTYVNSTNRKER